MRTLFSVVAVAAGSTLAAGQMTPLNGGFEAGTGADADGWEQVTLNAGSYAIRSDTDPISGGWSAEVFAVGAEGSGGLGAFAQNVNNEGGFPSLVPGSTLRLTGDVFTDLGPGGVAFAKLATFDRDGNEQGFQLFTIAGQGASSFDFTLDVPAAFGPDPLDLYTVQVELSVNAGAFDGSQGLARFDNVVLEASFVPTPGSLAILGLGGLAATRRRR